MLNGRKPLYAPSKCDDGLAQVSITTNLVKEYDNEVVTNTEVRLVELVGHVEAEALEFPTFEKDCMEPCQGEQQLSVAESLFASIKLLLPVECMAGGAQKTLVQRLIARAGAYSRKREAFEIVACPYGYTVTSCYKD